MLSCTTSTPLVANRLPGARPILRPFQSSTKAIRLITSTAAHKSNDASTNQQSASFVDPMTTSAAVACTFFLSEAAAHADAIVSGNPFQGVQSNSLYVTLALFLMSVPGIWSQVKRAPKANKKRKTFEVDGPGKEGALSIDDRARQLYRYFKSYNYSVKETGEVITFVGTYAADKGQAAAVTFYTFVGMASVALVLSILVPSVGNWWYGLTALSPAAWFYYYQKGERQEEFKIKMVIADNDQTIDIVCEGDIEEIERMRRELGFVEKGMVLVKGILEQ